MPWTERAPWVLIRQLRAIMASASEPQAKLDNIVKVIASNMIAEVSSIYVRLPDDSLELFATEGLRKEAVHTLRMKKGEGLVGLIADWGEPINLTDAQKHPNFSYKPETGEEVYHSFLGVPMVRDRRTIGVLTVQNKIERRYTDEEVEALETTAMVLAEMIASGNFAGTAVSAADRREASITLTGTPLNDGLALGHIALHDPRPQVLKFFADNIPAELKRLEEALLRLREDINRLLVNDEMSNDEHKEIIETVQMLAHDRGWARRMREAVSAGLTAEAAVERVQQNTRTQLMKNADSFWRERSHDLDDLANRMLRISARPRPRLDHGQASERCHSGCAQHGRRGTARPRSQEAARPRDRGGRGQLRTSPSWRAPSICPCSARSPTPRPRAITAIPPFWTLAPASSTSGRRWN